MSDSDFYGLTRNPWPGTWSPLGDQPIVLDRELRGSLRWISGDSGDQLANISGQRLQNGMLVYVQKRYVDSALAYRDSADSDGYIDSSIGQWTSDSDIIINPGYYVYYTDSNRDELTGRLGNTPQNWKPVNLFFDSDDVENIIDSDYLARYIDSAWVNARVTFDSNEVIHLVDSAYIQSRIKQKIVPDSDYIDARVQVLEVSDLVGEFGLRDDILRSDGLGNAYWDHVLLLDSAELLRLVDSAYVRERQLYIDSPSTIALITLTVDSDYVIARSAPGIDSSAIQLLIDSSIFEQVDSAYVQERTNFTQGNVDSAVRVSVAELVDSDYLLSIYGQRLVDSNYLDARIQTLTISEIIGAPGYAGQFVRTDGQNAYWASVRLLESSEVEYIADSSIEEIDSAFIFKRLPQYVQTSSNVFDSEDIFNLIDSVYLAPFFAVVDSDYIDARIQVIELDDIINTKPSSYNQVLVSQSPFTNDLKYESLENLARISIGLMDSDKTRGLVDTGYIYDIATTAGLGLDSNEVAGIILGYYDSDVFFFTGVDSNYILSRIDPNLLYDSSKVQIQIDSNLVDFTTSAGKYAYLESSPPLYGGGFEALVDYFVDSALIYNYVTTEYISGNITYETILQIIDSSGGVAPTDSGIKNLIDSAYIKNVIDSNYILSIAINESATIDLINLYGTDSEEIMAMIDSDLTDLENGLIPNFVAGRIQSLDIGDIVGNNGTANFFLQSKGNGDAQWIEIEEYLDRFDSEEIIAIIDSAYVNQRVDSNLVRSYVGADHLALYIDSNWINSRWDSSLFFLNAGGGSGSGIDSALVIQLIDSNYINSRVDDLWLDSAETIALIDSDYVLSRTYDQMAAMIQGIDIGDIVGTNGVFNQVLRSLGTGEAQWVDVEVTIDSAIVTNIIDSAYINDRVVDPGGIDSALVIQLIDSAYVLARVGETGIDSASIIQLIDSNYVIARTADEIDARIQVLDLGDIVGAAGLAGQYLRSLGTGDGEWVSITDDALDSAAVIDLIDSAYVLSKLGAGFGTALDSALAIQLIDVYGFDSTNALALIDQFALDSQTAIPLIQQYSLDSNEILTLVDSAYVLARSGGAGIDSDSIIQLIDSAYVQARINTSDSDINDLIDAKVQILDLGDIVGAAGLAGQFLASTGTGDGYWTDVLDSAAVLKLIDSNYIGLYSLDSQETLSLIYANSIDSVGVFALIDSAYVSSRTIFDSQETLSLIYANSIDSVGVFALIDSAYINFRVDATIDSDAVFALIDSNYVSERVRDEISGQIQVLDIGDIVGAAGLVGQYLRSLGTGDAEWADITDDALDSAAVLQLIDSAYVSARAPSSADFLDSQEVIALIDSAYINFRVDPQQFPDVLDSAAVIDLIDSAYINFRVDPQQFPNILDSANIIDLIDSAYINDRVVFDSNEVLSLIDSAYINFRVDPQQFSDSAAVLSLIDSAYVIERAQDEIAAQIQAQDVGDIVGSTGVTGQILTSLGTGGAVWTDRFDSEEVISLILEYIDSAYVGARSIFDSAETLSLINANSIDSAGTIRLIDSAYINARVSFDSNETIDLIYTYSIDSVGVIGLIDSAYINFRVDATIDSDAVFSLIDSNYVSERTRDEISAQIQAIDLGDVVGSNGTFGQVLSSLGNGQGAWIKGFDSAESIALILSYIDSAYVTARAFFDSSETLSLIAQNSIDSVGVFALIDSAYVSSRTIFDSEETLTLIFANSIDSNGVFGLIDSAYINFRVDATIDSDAVFSLIDSAYVTERSEDNAAAQIQATDLGDIVGSNGLFGQTLVSLGNGGASWEDKFDSNEVLTLIDSAYIQLRQVAPNYIFFGLDSAVENETDTELRTMGGTATGWRMPVGGTVTNVSMQLNVTTNSASQTLTAELVKNGTKTGKTVSVDVSSAGFTGTDSAISETYAAGDRLTLYITTSDAVMVTNDHNAIIRVLENI